MHIFSLEITYYLVLHTFSQVKFSQAMHWVATFYQIKSVPAQPIKNAPSVSCHLFKESKVMTMNSPLVRIKIIDSSPKFTIPQIKKRLIRQGMRYVTSNKALQFCQMKQNLSCEQKQYDGSNFTCSVLL